MPFPRDCLVKVITDRLNTLSSCVVLDEFIYNDAQISGAFNIESHTNKVPNLQSLPDAECNKGRFFYVEDIKSFRYSDGYYWTKDACSVLGDVNTYSSLWTWGCNTIGRLGDGTGTNRSSPGTVAGGGSWCEVSGGCFHMGAIKSDGTLWTWGDNSGGRLGDGTTVNRSSPGTIWGGGTNWCQIFSSDESAFFASIKTDGTLWTWGYNNVGSLGDGTLNPRCSPGTVAGGGTTWCQVSSGSFHGLAIKTDGTLWTWGDNNFGKLGNGTTVSRLSPGTIFGGGTTWCQVSGESNHTLAIKTDGTLWTWGCNSYGQLGDGTTVSRCSPGTVSGGGCWCQVSTGRSNTLAVKTDGTLWTWGCNTFGQLGDGTTVSRSSPGTVFGGGTTWCQVSNGVSHSTSIKTDGTLWTWGEASGGKLGNGTLINRCSPGTVAGGATTWCQVIAGRYHTSAIKTRGF